MRPKTVYNKSPVYLIGYSEIWYRGHSSKAEIFYGNTTAGKRFFAVTTSQSKLFKTITGARNYLNRLGYVERRDLSWLMSK